MGDARLNADEEPIDFHDFEYFWNYAENQVEIRGRMRDPSDATLVAVEGFVGLTMFDVRSVASLRMESVSFDARDAASDCLEIRDPFQFSVTDAPHEITRCSFRGGIVGAPATRPVELTALVRAQRSHAYGATPGVSMPHSAPSLTFDGCMFEIMSTSGVAVRVIGDGASAAEFRSCIFVGSAAAMVHASSFEVIASNCRFQNESIPSVLRSPTPANAATRRDVLALHALAPQGGLDVFLDGAQTLLPVDALPPPPPPPAPPPPPGPRTPSVGDILLDLLIPFAGPVLAAKDLARRTYRTATSTYSTAGITPQVVTHLPQRSIFAQDCRSTSPQFLATAQSADRSSMSDGVLIGLHHGYRDPAFSQVPIVRPPAVHWRAAAGDPAVALILTGCRFDRVTSTDLERVVAPVISPLTRPAVMEYGVCDGDYQNRVQFDTAGLLSSGMRVGYVPPRP